MNTMSRAARQLNEVQTKLAFIAAQVEQLESQFNFNLMRGSREILDAAVVNLVHGFVSAGIIKHGDIEEALGAVWVRWIGPMYEVTINHSALLSLIGKNVSRYPV